MAEEADFWPSPDDVLDELERSHVLVVYAGWGAGKTRFARRVADLVTTDGRFGRVVYLRGVPDPESPPDLPDRAFVIIDDGDRVAEADAEYAAQFARRALSRFGKLLVVGREPPAWVQLATDAMNWRPPRAVELTRVTAERAKQLREERDRARAEAGRRTDVPAQVAIVWDPELVSPEDYADLVEALGDVVRASGGAGLRRIREAEQGVELGVGVTL